MITGDSEYREAFAHLLRMHGIKVEHVGATLDGWSYGYDDAGLGVYVRDIGQLIGPLVIVLMFLGPVFYPRSALPEALQGLMAMNPITIPIEQFRRALFEGLWPDWSAVAQYSLVALVVYLAGVYVFRILRKGFADVL